MRRIEFRRFLLFIQFWFIPILLYCQDFSIFVNTPMLCETNRIEILNDTIYTEFDTYIDGTYYGFTILQLDSMGKKLKELKVFDSSLIFATYFYQHIGFKLTGSRQLLLYGNAGGGGQTMKNFLAITDTDLTGYSIHFYDHISAQIQLTGSTDLLVTPTAYYLLGQEQTTDQYGTSNVFVIKTDLEGNEIWRRSYGLAALEDIAFSIIQKSDNEIVIGGGRGTPFFDFDANPLTVWTKEWLIAIDSSGNQLWEWLNPNEFRNRSAILNLKISGDSYFYNSANTWWGGFNEQWVGISDFNRRDTNFNLIWRTPLPISAPNWNHNIWGAAITPDSLSILGVGRPDQITGRAFHWKVNLEDGTEIFYRLDSACTNTDIRWCDLYDVAMLSSGSSVACGYAELITPVGIAHRGWLLKTNAWGVSDLGDCLPVSIFEPQYTGMPITVYPNPAIDQITLDLPAVSKKYEVRLIDTAGRIILRERRGEEKPMLDITSIPGGLYFVQVVSEPGVVLAVGKVVKI